MRLTRAVTLLVGAALTLTACGSGPADNVAAAPPAASAVASGAPVLSGKINVFAAASLTSAFGQIAKNFQAAHPGVTVTLNLGGSSALAQQIVAGAPADVFAAASPATMKTVVAAGDASAPTVFARNRLEIAVPPDNPGTITGLADFGRASATIALCAPEVPCGAAASKVFAAAGITAKPDTLEQDVKAVLSKVTLGEVDAGLVYRTDVLAAGSKVKGLEFPEAAKAINDYPVVRLAAAANPAAADAFVAYVLGAEGQAVLAAAGFDTV